MNETKSQGPLDQHLPQYKIRQLQTHFLSGSSKVLPQLLLSEIANGNWVFSSNVLRVNKSKVMFCYSYNISITPYSPPSLCMSIKRFSPDPYCE